jgi:phage I-like protein
VLAAVRVLCATDDDDEGAGAHSDDDDEAQDGTDDGADDCADDDGGTAAGTMLAGGGGAADPARYVAVAHFQRVLGELNQIRAERASARAVDDAIRAGKLIPAQRQWAVSYCHADFKGFAAFAARQPAAFGAGFESAQTVFSAPAAAPAAALTAVETAVCAQLGLSAGDYQRRKRSGRGDFLRLNRGND